jgi:alpha-2-macroglobulin
MPVRFLPLLFALLMCFGCSSKEDGGEPLQMGIAEDLLGKKIALADYVVAKPAKVLSALSFIELEFKRPMVPPHLVGADLGVGPVELSPALEAKASWVSTTLLRLQPKNPLPAGQKFSGKLVGKKAFGAGVDVDNYPFTFQVAQRELLEVTGGFVPDVKQVNQVKLELELRFSQPADTAKLNHDLEIEDNGTGLKFTTLRDGDGRHVRVVTEPRARLDKERTFTFELPGSYTVNGEKFEQNFTLAAAGEFKVVSEGEASDPKSDERSWAFRFSDPVSANMDLSGFVSVEPKTNYKVIVQGNTLKVRGAFEPGATYTVRLTEGLPSAYNTKMAQYYVKEVFFRNEKPRIDWVGDGIYLPLENKSKLQFQSMNVRKVRLTVQEVLPQNLGFFLQNNDLRSLNSEVNEYGYGDGEDEDGYYGYGRSLSDVERTAKTVYEKEIVLDKAPRNRWHKVELDLAEKLRNKAGSAFVIRLSFDDNNLVGRCVSDLESFQQGDLYYPGDSYYGNPCNSGYYYGRGDKERLVIVSSIGLTAKQTVDGIHVWATDVATAEPVRGLNLELMSRLNEQLETQGTGGDGHAFFKTKDFKEGFVVRGVHKRGFALLKLNGTNWETSRFETDGVMTESNELRFFGYADRGVHRPGDTIHFAGLVRSGVAIPPAGLPMHLVVKDPQGTAMQESDAVASPEGLVAIDIPTDLGAPTGTWTAEVSTGGQTWYHSLRVETVKPNRLKNKLDLPDLLQGNKTHVGSLLESKYLFGTPAAGLKAEVSLLAVPRSVEFKRYPEFTFRNPMLYFDEVRSTLYEGPLDEKGQYRMDTELPDLSGVPEAATVRFKVKVYEKGGDYTESWHTVPVDPFPAWVGVQSRNNWYGVRTGDTLRVPVVAVDNKGKPLEGRRLKVRVYQNRRYSWWEGTRQDRWDFRTQQQTYLVHESEIRSAAAPREFKWVPTDEAQLFVEVIDEKGGHSTGFYVYSSQWGSMDVSRKVPEASHLALQTDKATYAVNSKLQVYFNAPAGARALVTLEQNGKVFDSRWVKTNAGQNRAEFPVTAEMVPNVYAVVSLILPHKEAAGDRPLRLYGIKSVGVEDPNTRLNLKIKAPKEVKPDQDFVVEVKNNSKEAASFTVAVVDEGLLDLTNFKTPDPWEFYFRKMALNLMTLDNLDEIIGALLPDMDTYLSVGGDGEMAQRRGHPKVQRFKAVSLFSGVKQVGAGQNAKVKFKMPHYVGSVRVMVIGASQRGFVGTDTVMAVRQPLMVLPTLPRVARPGDRFDIPVSVFAMDNQVKSAKVSLELPPELKALGPTSQDVTFSGPGEKDVKFSVQVAAKIGAAKVVIRATGSGHKAFEVVELPIMSPGAYVTDVVENMVDAGKSATFAIKPFGIDKTHKATLVLSAMPSIRIDERLNYLIRYPYGCVEQTTSSVFPQLYLEKLTDLNPQRKKEVAANIQAGIERLRSFALDKGFTYWPGDGYSSSRVADAWATSYVGHFLLEAKRLGYNVPQSLLDSWKGWEKDMAKQVKPDNHRYQAYRLYLLALAGEPQMGAMNLLRENYAPVLDPLSRRLLAASYQLAGQKAVAQQVLTATDAPIAKYRELSGTYGSSIRDQGLSAWVLLQMGHTQEAQRVYKSLVDDFKQYSWWSTQETVFTLLAFSALTSTFSGSDIEVEWGPAGGALQKKVVSTKRTVRIDLTKFGERDIVVRALNGLVFAEVHTEGLPLEDRIQTGNSGLRIERSFYDSDGLPMTMAQIQQAQAFWVVYRVQNTGTNRVEGLALSSLFPAGFEIVNERLSEDDGPAWVRNLKRKTADYTDIRDDRVNWFFNLYANETADFAVQVHPSYAGEFRWPGLVLEAMYSPEYYARIAGQKVGVK